jgi:hypothetical protein
MGRRENCNFKAKFVQFYTFCYRVKTCQSIFEANILQFFTFSLGMERTFNLGMERTFSLGK